jgi:DASS family divalent anion:Na+ symporter
LAILGWALGSYLKLDATAVAVAFVAAALLTGIITWENVLSNKGAWSTFTWYAGTIGLADALTKAKFFEWFAKMIGANINFSSIHVFVLLAILVFFTVVVRYVFSSMATFVATMIPVLFTIGKAAGIPTVPLVFLIAFASAYGGMITHYSGPLAAILFGAGYVNQLTWWKIGAFMAFMSFVTTFAVSLPYWSLLGLW